MLSNATNQPKSTVELGYMCPRGLTEPYNKIAFSLYSSLLSIRYFELGNPETWKPLLFNDIPNDVSECCQTEVWLIERSVWVQSFTQVNFAD